jgi:hypothetical protein
VNLDPQLLEILACPACRSPLAVDADRNELVCTGCGLAYPVRDDIPILLVDEARRPAGGADTPALENTGDDRPPSPDDDA